MIAYAYRMISIICSIGLKPGYCSSIQLNVCIFGSQKCSYIKFTYYLDRSIIKKVPSTSYLGITIDLGLTWSDHVTRVVAKANSALGFLQYNLKYCPPEIIASCFKSHVIPILGIGFPTFKKIFMP